MMIELDPNNAPDWKARGIKFKWFIFKCGHRRRWWKTQELFYCMECDDTVELDHEEEDIRGWV